jgi:hypothetical protein
MSNDKVAATFHPTTGDPDGVYPSTSVRADDLRTTTEKEADDNAERARIALARGKRQDLPSLDFVKPVGHDGEHFAARLARESVEAAEGQKDADALRQVLREQGLDTGGASPHSWRCENPDRYPGYCTCVEDMVQAIIAAGFHRHRPAVEPANPADVNAADLGLPTGLP